MIRVDLAQARTTWLQSFQHPRQRADAEQGAFLAYRSADGFVAEKKGRIGRIYLPLRPLPHPDAGLVHVVSRAAEEADISSCGGTS